jgi:TPR repeat protein
VDAPIPYELWSQDKLTEAAEKHDVKALIELGFRYECGDVEFSEPKPECDKDLDTYKSWMHQCNWEREFYSKKYYTLASRIGGRSEFAFYQGYYYLFYITDDDFDSHDRINRGIKYYEQSAANGFAYAQYRLSLITSIRKATDDWQEKAFNYLIDAGKNGLLRAMRKLIDTHLLDDDDQCIYWLEQASEAGCHESTCKLAEFYKSGKYVEKNPEYALDLYDNSIADGCSKAKLGKALLLLEDPMNSYEEDIIDSLEDCLLDDKRYFDAIVKAAEKAAPFIKTFIAHCYANGTPIRSPKKAIEWFADAAHAGDVEAQRELAEYYSRGEAVPKDDAMAYAWWNIAAANGCKSSATARDELADDMLKEQIAEGQRLSRELLVKND